MIYSAKEISNNHGIETAILILCIRSHFSTAKVEELQSFVLNNSWCFSKLKKIARFHRIEPIIYKSLLSIPNEFEQKQSCSQIQSNIIFRNWQLAAETERIIKLFELANIKAIPYKGTMFSKQFYGDLVSRSSSDIDLIIKWEDLWESVNLLELHGYVPESKVVKDFYGINLKNRQNEYNMDFYSNGKRQFHIELHWDIGSKDIGISPKMDQFFECQKEPMLLLNQGVPCLTSSAHFNAIFVHHACKDIFMYLRDLVDICQALIVIHKKEEWASISEWIKENRQVKAYQTSKKLIENLFEINLPNLFESKIPDKTYYYFEKKLLNEQILTITRNTFSIYFICQSYFKRLLLSDNFKEKYLEIKRFIRVILFPNCNDYEYLPLKKQWHFLYYILKPFRLVAKAIK